MFTGIIESIGQLVSSEERGGDRRMVFKAGSMQLEDVRNGDSIAVAGVCLTALDISAETFAADVSLETLKLTTLGKLESGASVNLEKALRLSDRLGGHLVSGHIDGLGRVVDIHADARSQRWSFEIAAELARYIASKGSICIDGVSLTVNEVDGLRFGVNLIPHTQQVTTFAQRRVGDAVNIEVDRMARYAERLVEFREKETSELQEAASAASCRSAALKFTT
ncbi:MAG TPA: riboflavin synthase [Dokdonella sp.]|uniref:riboflavin synthase n=1 Tax=Dokdonella sp. TaxID=2291710 RepID=UPI002D7ED6A2|nr:riboflavin synthase [Dokdonella sp.]HET9033959.1 riboflavin synthase [Dokdonella sp.]